MKTERHTNVDADDTAGNSPPRTRRAVLAGVGTVALGSLAGCTAVDGLLDRASEEAVGNRTASPAGFYGGIAIDQLIRYRSGPVDVRFVPPTLQADSRRIEIDGWSTTTTTKAKDLNSSRSNKPRSIWVPNPDVDGDGIGDFVELLDIERSLLVYADAAIEAVDDRSNDDANRFLDAFISGTTEVRAELDDCTSETCTTVRENADGRAGLARDASDAVAAGEWDSAKRSMQQARRIVQGDIERIDGELANNPLYEGDGDDRINPLHGYLAGEPTIGEGFVVSLPDAQVRGDGPALADELTPKRVLDYFTGEQNADGCAESDRAVAVHEDLSCRDLLSATLTGGGPGFTGKKEFGRAVAAFETSGGVVVTGATPAADVAEPILRVAPDNTVSPVESLNSWGEEWRSDGLTVSSALVLPVAATPADAQYPMPALFHVRRIWHEDQLLFVGGWHLDDGALYENAATLLAADGPNLVAGVTRSDIEDGGVDLQSLAKARRKPPRKKPGRTKFGDITLKTQYDPDAEHLPAGAHPVCRDDGDVSYWGVQSREALARHDTGDCNDGSADVHPSAVTTALDAPVLHLVGAADASNDVKFKAGAELSKAVN